MSPEDAAILQELARRALDPSWEGERAVAAAAWFAEGGPADEEDLVEFLDFVALHWVDAEGWTLLERVAAPLGPRHRGWLEDDRAGVFVVDGREAPGRLLVRDAADDARLVLLSPDALEPRTVIEGRLVPAGEGCHVPVGSPRILGPMGVVARMDRLRRWQESPRRALVDRTRSLRRAFLAQREQHAAWVAWFGSEVVVRDDPDLLEGELNRFLRHYLDDWRVSSMGGLSPRQAHALRTGRAASEVAIAIAPELKAAAPLAAVFDEREGFWVLPWWTRLVDHLEGRGSWPEVLRFYLEEPDLTALPFRHAASPERVAAALGVDPGPVAEMVAARRPLPARVAPSLLPDGFEP